MRVMTGCLLLVATLGACSDRTTPAKDLPVPVWPDLRRYDRARPDRGLEARPVDLDQAVPDGVADIGPREARPDLPPMGWKKVGLLTSKNLHAVACVQGHVFAVGDGGTILHRAPGSILFQPQDAKDTTGTGTSTADFHALAFAADATKTYGVLAGKDPGIWQTTDLGTTWDIAPQCSSYVFDTFYALHLNLPGEGFGAGVASNNQGGGAKYYAGYSWVCSSPTHPGEIFYDVFRVGTSGWIVGDTAGKLYRSEDSGITWTSTSAGTSQVLRGVHLRPTKVGVAVGNGGTIVRSADGLGNLWAPVTSGVTADLYDVFFWDNLTGWAAGDSGTVLRTDDGGLVWKKQVTPTTARLEAVCFTSATEGWIAGAGGALLQTTTGGVP
jgi:photosystem II stability/assembly factor-like uncharacterized protein